MRNRLRRGTNVYKYRKAALYDASTCALRLGRQSTIYQQCLKVDVSACVCVHTRILIQSFNAVSISILKQTNVKVLILGHRPSNSILPAWSVVVGGCLSIPVFNLIPNHVSKYSEAHKNEPEQCARSRIVQGLILIN